MKHCLIIVLSQIISSNAIISELSTKSISWHGLVTQQHLPYNLKIYRIASDTVMANRRSVSLEFTYVRANSVRPYRANSNNSASHPCFTTLKFRFVMISIIKLQIRRKVLNSLSEWNTFSFETNTLWREIYFVITHLGLNIAGTDRQINSIISTPVSNRYLFNRHRKSQPLHTKLLD